MTLLSRIAKKTARMVAEICGYTPVKVGSGWTIWPTDLPASLQARQLLRHVRESQPDIEADDHIVQVIERYGINVVIDVGANVGQYGMRLRQSGYNKRICSVEPVAEIYSHLKKQANLDVNWKTYNLALGSRSGEKNINVTTNSVFSSFLHPNLESKQLYGEFSASKVVERVRLRPLDECFPEMTVGIDAPRALLKIDTQGYDIEVCDGAVESLKNVFVIQSELSVLPIYNNMPTWIEAIQYYAKSGFVPVAMTPIAYDPRTLQIIEFDGLFIRNEKKPIVDSNSAK